MTTTEKLNIPEPVRTPLLAVLGAGDYAAKAVADAFAKAKARAEETRTAVEDLPSEVAGLREKLDPAELRKLLDAYTSAAVSLYKHLAEHGEEALGKLREQPQGKQLEDVIVAAQVKAGDVAGDAREVAEDVLSKVTRKTRSVGEKTAIAVEDATEDLALAVEEAGGEVAHEVRSTARKAANKTDPARKPAAKATPAAAKPAAKPTTAK